MNSHTIDGFPSQNPPIYPKPTHGLQSLYPPPNPTPQFHQPIPPPNPNPKPPINPHHLHLHPPNPPIHPPPPLPSIYGGSSDYEQRLRDEVIYLHSLWHRGPPRTLIQQTHFSNPQIRNPNLSNFNLKPNPPTTPFKKKKKKNNKPIKSRVVSDKEWPVDPKPAAPSPTGWAEFKAAGRAATRPAPAEEQERVLAVRVHLKGLDSCIGFFRNDDDGDENGGDDGEEEYDEEEVFEFFWGVFEGDEKLREYYKTKFENGEFYCLVCGVVAKQQLGRKYKNCVALVQHSVTISKTKKKIAHRGFGRAVCRVLGWDIDQLPSLASAISGCVSVNNNAAVDETPKPGDSEPPVSQDNIPSR